ncbi:hypothetical protein EK21DRAFT_93060 [Setomelanomma holmii]|uniref:F-box domain-containing protein n=1 Tax=Setomelanomma holmii TaxID=210430 RepID=A0A9P4H1M5_9PLEO|nr:hypothetical protein EK21DRAFT_93060 [Setomelanomma holmii]
MSAATSAWPTIQTHLAPPRRKRRFEELQRRAETRTFLRIGARPPNRVDSTSIARIWSRRMCLYALTLWFWFLRRAWPPAVRQSRRNRQVAQLAEVVNSRLSALHQLPVELLLEVSEYLGREEIAALIESCKWAEAVMRMKPAEKLALKPERTLPQLPELDTVQYYGLFSSSAHHSVASRSTYCDVCGASGPPVATYMQHHILTPPSQGSQGQGQSS